MKEGEILYIDAYNVIHALPELQQERLADLDAARWRLVEWLASYGAYSGRRVVVVFDAHLNDNPESREQPYPELEIIFTAAGETADAYIERDTRRAAAAGATVYVVTGDYSQQLQVLGGGALRMPVRELRETMGAARCAMTEGHGTTGLRNRNELGGRLKAEVTLQLERIRRQS